MWGKEKGGRRLEVKMKGVGRIEEERGGGEGWGVEGGVRRR